MIIVNHDINNVCPCDFINRMVEKEPFGVGENKSFEAESRSLLSGVDLPKVGAYRLIKRGSA